MHVKQQISPSYIWVIAYFVFTITYFGVMVCSSIQTAAFMIEAPIAHKNTRQWHLCHFRDTQQQIIMVRAISNQMWWPTINIITDNIWMTYGIFSTKVLLWVLECLAGGGVPRVYCTRTFVSPSRQGMQPAQHGAWLWWQGRRGGWSGRNIWCCLVVVWMLVVTQIVLLHRPHVVHPALARQCYEVHDVPYLVNTCCLLHNYTRQDVFTCVQKSHHTPHLSAR